MPAFIFVPIWFTYLCNMSPYTKCGLKFHFKSIGWTIFFFQMTLCSLWALFIVKLTFCCMSVYAKLVSCIICLISLLNEYEFSTSPESLTVWFSEATLYPCWGVHSSTLCRLLTYVVYCILRRCADKRFYNKINKGVSPHRKVWTQCMCVGFVLQILTSSPGLFTFPWSQN